MISKFSGQRNSYSSGGSTKNQSICSFEQSLRRIQRWHHSQKNWNPDIGRCFYRYDDAGGWWRKNSLSNRRSFCFNDTGKHPILENWDKFFSTSRSVNLWISHIVLLSANNVSGGFLSTNKTVFIQCIIWFPRRRKKKTIIKSLMLFVTSKYQTTQGPK